MGIVKYKLKTMIIVLIHLILFFLNSFAIASEQLKEYSNKDDKYPVIDNAERAKKFGVFNTKTNALSTLNKGRKFPAARSELISRPRSESLTSSESGSLGNSRSDYSLTTSAATSRDTSVDSSQEDNHLQLEGIQYEITESVNEMTLSHISKNKFKLKNTRLSGLVDDFMQEIHPRIEFKPVCSKKGDPFRDIKYFLQESHMGYFHFDSVAIAPVTIEDDSVKRRSLPKTRIDNSDNLIKGYLGEIWFKTTWPALCIGSQEVHAQIRHELKQRAPETMKHFPSLAPKKVREQQVLEGWLVNGLLLAYPLLNSVQLTKNEAVALILLAVLSRNFDEEIESQNVICKVIKGLADYIGPIPETESTNEFPLKIFTSSCNEDGRISRTGHYLLQNLFEIIDQKDLKYSAHVIRQIAKN